MHPCKATSFFRAGLVQLEQNKQENAKVNFLEALRLNPSLFEANFRLGCLSSYSGNYDEAISYFNKELNGSPNFAPAHYELANALLRQNSLLLVSGKVARKNGFTIPVLPVRSLNYAQDNLTALSLAKEHLEKAFENYSPDHLFKAHSAFELGLVYEKLGKHEKAEELFQTSEELYLAFSKQQINKPNVFYRLGILAEKKNDFIKALEFYVKEVEVNPNNEVARECAASILKRQGKYQEATKICPANSHTRTIGFVQPSPSISSEDRIADKSGGTSSLDEQNTESSLKPYSRHSIGFLSNGGN